MSKILWAAFISVFILTFVSQLVGAQVQDTKGAQTSEGSAAFIESDVTIATFKPLSRKVSTTKEQFEAQTVFVETPSSADRLVAFSIRLPKDWFVVSEDQFGASTLSGDVLSPVIKYVSPPFIDYRAYFSAQAAILKTQITAENWFANYSVSNGFSVEGMRVLSDKSVEAQYTKLENERSYIVRAVVKINGPRVILAEYALPLSVYEQKKDGQVWSTLSFRLLHPSDDPIEPVKAYSFLDLIGFLYPETWSLKPRPVETPERLFVDLFSTSREIDRFEDSKRLVKLEGKIEIQAFSKAGGVVLNTELAALKAEIDKKGFELGKILRKPKYKFHSSMKPIEADVYELQDKSGKVNNYEYSIAIMEGKDFFFIVSLFSPLQESDFLEWARNREAFRTVVESIR